MADERRPGRPPGGAQPPPLALRIALDAARAAGASLVGVDLLPTAGGLTIAEINGAVEFTASTARPATSFAEAALELGRAAICERPQPRLLRGRDPVLV